MKKSTAIFLSSTVLTLTACNMTVDENNRQSQQPVSTPVPSIPVIAIEEEFSDSDSEIKQQSEPVLLAPLVKKEVARMVTDQVKIKAVTAMVSGMSIASNDSYRIARESVIREKYAHYEDNGIKVVRESPVSTFSIDVDTGAYSNVRRVINSGSLPVKDMVRAEEMINYFSYDTKPLQTDAPFAVFTEVGPTPWNEGSHLMRVSVKASAIPKAEMKANNLVFLIDVSGSMQSPNKLGLLKKSLKLLTRQLDKNDKVSIVVYAGASGMVLEPVAGNEQMKIEQALQKLQAGGSTNGASGIRLAYQAAKQAFIEGGNNRVILATDGDFNVGTVDHNALLDLIEEKRKQGVFLTTLGFGQGNYNDHLMEQIADHGNGNYAYIDNLMEAKKVLVDEIGSTLETVAKDVKIQVEFNPAVVSEYRLVGYENRQLAREDFNNDKVDAGEIGAGHSVMALYEISLNGEKKAIEPLRYAQDTAYSRIDQGLAGEIAHVRLRYKPVNSDKSILSSFPVELKSMKKQLVNTSEDYRFASAVAAYAQKLRGGKHLDDYGYQQIEKLAGEARGKDSHGLRSNFLQMVGLTRSLDSATVN
ncbi:MAG: VWA domain-containing protein [Gammaproteobacteria bacterium]|nr:VWA domain-containing protein [Gammaproteobacteria bacterium]